MKESTVHEGRNVKRIREILGIKQDTLAMELGISQQAVSSIEQKEALDEDLLQKISQILKVPAEAIKNFKDETAINIISTTFQDFHDSAVGVCNEYHCNFKPLEKYIETLEENKKLYERLLQTEREKVTLLEKILDKK